MTDFLPIGYELSPRARAYFDARPERRDPKYTCSEAELVALLEKHGLPVSQAILDFERNFGGWCLLSSSTPIGFGVYLSLRREPNAPSISEAFRNSNLFDEAAGLEVDGADAPLFGHGYPRLLYGARRLVPAGMQGPDELYFLGSDGVVYLYALVLDELLTLAGSGAAWLEMLALRSRFPDFGAEVARLSIEQDIGRRLATRLDVPSAIEASDAVRENWVSDDFRIEVVHGNEVTPPRTHLFARSAAPLVTALQWIREEYPGVTLETPTGSKTIEDIESFRLAGRDIPLFR